MDDRIRNALETDRVIDITTTGRQSGEPRRIEIWFHNVGGRIYITGSPGTRDWYANLLADPTFTFHLKGSTQADLPAHARPITGGDERQQVLRGIVEGLGRDADLDAWLEGAPLVEVTFDDADQA